MANDIVAQLQKSLTAKSLSEIANERKLAFLLLDCSGSMGEYCEPNRPKIKALREIVASLKANGLIFTQVVFPGSQWGADIMSNIPDPGGGTPLHAALEVANVEDAKHIVLISDGMPDNTHSAELVARELKRKGVKIDVFYVGPYPHEGEKFLRSLSSLTGGQSQQTSLKASDMLAVKQKVKTALLEHRR